MNNKKFDVVIMDIVKGIHPELDVVPREGLIDNGVIDSFDMVLLLSALEVEFCIAVPGEDLVQENFNSIDSLVNLVKRCIANES